MVYICSEPGEGCLDGLCPVLHLCAHGEPDIFQESVIAYKGRENLAAHSCLHSHAQRALYLPPAQIAAQTLALLHGSTQAQVTAPLWAISSPGGVVCSRVRSFLLQIPSRSRIADSCFWIAKDLQKAQAWRSVLDMVVVGTIRPRLADSSTPVATMALRN